MVLWLYDHHSLYCVMGGKGQGGLDFTVDSIGIPASLSKSFVLVLLVGTLSVNYWKIQSQIIRF